MFRIMRDQDILVTRRLLQFKRICPNPKMSFSEILTTREEGLSFQINVNQDLQGDAFLCYHRHIGDGCLVAGPCTVSYCSG